MHYTINMIRSLRESERKALAQKTFLRILTMIAFGVLGCAFIYGVFQVLSMNRVIYYKTENLQRLHEQFKKYKETKESVNRQDVVLLDKLQNGKVFWTKKLATIAKYLPDNYWTTSFSFNGESFNVSGYGYAGNQQKQLVILDKYITDLKSDTVFMDIFENVYLNSLTKEKLERRALVHFNISAVCNENRVK